MVGCGSKVWLNAYESLICGFDRIGGELFLCDDCLKVALKCVSNDVCVSFGGSFI